MFQKKKKKMYRKKLQKKYCHGKIENIWYYVYVKFHKNIIFEKQQFFRKNHENLA